MGKLKVFRIETTREEMSDVMGVLNSELQVLKRERSLKDDKEEIANYDKQIKVLEKYYKAMNSLYWGDYDFSNI